MILTLVPVRKGQLGCSLIKRPFRRTSRFAYLKTGVISGGAEIKTLRGASRTLVAKIKILDVASKTSGTEVKTLGAEIRIVDTETETLGTQIKPFGNLAHKCVIPPVTATAMPQTGMCK